MSGLVGSRRQQDYQRMPYFWITTVHPPILTPGHMTQSNKQRHSPNFSQPVEPAYDVQWIYTTNTISV
jgi:hypothetical protein